MTAKRQGPGRKRPRPQRSRVQPVGGNLPDQPPSDAAAVGDARAPTLPPPLQQTDRTFVLAGGRKVTYFGGCDYFRLSSHPAVLAAMSKGLERFGLNVAASRKTTGNHRLYELLEERLAGFFGVEAAVLVSSGYVSNLAVAQALAGQFTHALLDDGAHNSLVDATKFLDCPVRLP